MSKTAEQLRLSRRAILRGDRIAAISPQAKEEARKCRFDNNQHALLLIARETTPEAQVQKVLALVGSRQKSCPPRSSLTTESSDAGAQIAQQSQCGHEEMLWLALKAAWNNATPTVRDRFITECLS